jgi:hypothetical protein
MVQHESLVASGSIEFSPSQKAQIIAKVKEICSDQGFHPAYILVFGSALHSPAPSDIDVLVITNFDGVVFQAKEIPPNDQLPTLDIKIVGRRYIDIILEKHSDQVSETGANLNLPLQEQWLPIALHTGVALYGDVSGLKEQIETAAQIYSNLKARGILMERP